MHLWDYDWRRLIQWIQEHNRTDEVEEADTRSRWAQFMQSDSEPEFYFKDVAGVVAARFSEHVETERLLLSHQSAYRFHYSTERSIPAVHVPTSMPEVSVFILLNLSAAFDTVDHITQHKIQQYTQDHTTQFLLSFGINSFGLVWSIIDELNIAISASWAAIFIKCSMQFCLPHSRSVITIIILY